MPTRKSTIVGVFNTRAEAEHAIEDLKRARFKATQIGLVARDADGRIVTTEGGDGAESLAEEGAVAGAVAGAGAGALVGLGVLSGVIPVIGPAIAAGTLGVILTNAVGGAAIAGIVGALIGLGIPEEDASYYEGEVKSGRFLVTVSATNGRASEAWDILHRRGAYNRAAATTATNANPRLGANATRDAGQTVQLKEEQLRVNKTPVQAGEVEVRKEVHTEHKQIEVPVEREEVVIERRPVHGRAAAGDLQAQEIRIPVKDEKVHVTKEAVVTEEVSVGKRKVRGTETVAGTVRKEELKVEETGDVSVSGATPTHRRR